MSKFLRSMCMTATSFAGRAGYSHARGDRGIFKFGFELMHRQFEMPVRTASSYDRHGITGHCLLAGGMMKRPKLPQATVNVNSMSSNE